MACIRIKLSAIQENLVKTQELALRNSLELMVVTKSCCSEKAIVKLLCDNDVSSIADSNMANFAALPPELSGRCTKTVIKTRLSDIRAIPSLSEAARPQRIFVSDEALVKAAAELSAELPAGQRPKITLIMELGDYRDGFYPEDLSGIIKTYPDLRYDGVSANFACLSGKMPDPESLRILRACAETIPARYGTAKMSVGGTVLYSLLEKNALPEFTGGIAAEFRIGEGLFFGCDPSSGAPLPAFRRDPFTLCGEIVEIRKKDIKPIENPGHTTMGGEAPKRKMGKRLCAVLDFGMLGAHMKDLKPLDGGAEIVGQTFDFTVVDITESAGHYTTGELFPFITGYAAASQAMLNPYVARLIE
jgi:predicted amino acid racemase